MVDKKKKPKPKKVEQELDPAQLKTRIIPTEELLKSLGETKAEPKKTTFLPKIDGYEVIEEIGIGGMGRVFKARQTSMDRLVAIKVLANKFSKDPDYIARFLQEVKIVGKLNHSHIVQGIDAGQCDGLYYFAMEFVDGKSLDEILEAEGVLDDRKAVEIVLQIAQALQAANEVGLVHRDIKPANIYLNHKGEAKLGDLGLAKSSSEKSSSRERGTVVGTPYYMSPEQARAESTIDIRSDIYSLGVTFYQMLCGTVPFKGNSIVITLSMHMNEDAPSIGSINPDANVAVKLIVAKMMAKHLSDRYQLPEELIKDLEAFKQGGKVTATVLRAPGRPKSQTKSYKFSKVLSDDEVIFSMIALKSKLITAEQLKECLDKQENNLQYGQKKSLSLLLVETGYITQEHVKAILRTQEEHIRKLKAQSFGALAVQRGLVSKEQVQQALDQQAKLIDEGGHAFLGDLLVQIGKLTKRQVKSILQVQEQSRLNKEDIGFGKIVHSLGMISTADMNECIREQKRLKTEGVQLRLSELLVNNDYLTVRERDVVLRAMKRMLLTGQSLGDLMIEQSVDDRILNAKKSSGRETILISKDDLVLRRKAARLCPACKARVPDADKHCPACDKPLVD